MEYEFYFDEIFHDRKISASSQGILNVMTDNKNDSYIGVFWGQEQEKLQLILAKAESLEAVHKQKYGLEEDAEFKSTIIGKKNFQYGIKSFNKNCLSFFDDFFRFLQEAEPVIHVNTASKIELLVRNIFDLHTMKQVPYVLPKVFYYSLTKFIMFYQSPNLIKSLYRAAETGNAGLFKDELLNHIKHVLSAISDIERKEKEFPIYLELYLIIDSIELNNTIKNKYDFVYFHVFDGLKKLLQEKHIAVNGTKVNIDFDENTYKVASSYDFKATVAGESNNMIGLRVADHLCGFIGRMMRAMSNDVDMQEDVIDDIEKIRENDLQRKRLLSLKWFDLQEEQYELYKVIYSVLVKQQEAFWAAMTWSYCDQTIMFYVLLKYIASYDTFDSYKKISLEVHREYYNYGCCMELEEHYKNLIKK